ncbi:Bug family tripartite tricarboxylate transporter substrate binding protein [Marinobacterium stanieri]|uniref:Bug family tripartite tricarboxylate transporter substrate binding protein n=1 Tax=Marinobacterium stanieri TaxID=49186 RepID=UPI00025587D8|nr:tripartite tricarboxylate transporter substrate binding protein [Marinobacterium stanieri]
MLMKKLRKLLAANTLLASATIATASTAVMASTTAYASDYPNKPVNFVVGFGVGGSADRMTRAMSSFLADELGEPIKVINKKGAGTQIAANYVLNRPGDGYTVFASTFAPYLSNTILKGNASYTIEDFSYLNFQWFDMDLIAVNKESPYQSLQEVLETIRNEPNKVRASVVQGSAGHLMLRLLLDVNNIPQENLALVTYNSGGKARSAVAGGQVDLISISAQGSEGIREFLRPLAIVSEERSNKWDAPTINEALKPMNTEVAVLPGSMRGFAVSTEFKQKHPERYQKLTTAIQNTLASKEVQSFLNKSDIGGVWVGPEKADALMKQNYETFKKYAHLLND